MFQFRSIIKTVTLTDSWENDIRIGSVSAGRCSLARARLNAPSVAIATQCIAMRCYSSIKETKSSQRFGLKWTAEILNATLKATGGGDCVSTGYCPVSSGHNVGRRPVSEIFLSRGYKKINKCKGHKTVGQKVILHTSSLDCHLSQSLKPDLSAY